MRDRPVLVVTSDLASRRGLEAALRSLGYRATMVAALDEAFGKATVELAVWVANVLQNPPPQKRP